MAQNFCAEYKLNNRQRERKRTPHGYRILQRGQRGARPNRTSKTAVAFNAAAPVAQRSRGQSA
eukprot:565572-Lingulodinium_polyedra.AAC.1